MRNSGAPAAIAASTSRDPADPEPQPRVHALELEGAAGAGQHVAVAGRVDHHVGRERLAAGARLDTRRRRCARPRRAPALPRRGTAARHRLVSRARSAPRAAPPGRRRPSSAPRARRARRPRRGPSPRSASRAPGRACPSARAAARTRRRSAVMRSVTSWHSPAITCLPRPSSRVSRSAIRPFVASPPSELDRLGQHDARARARGRDRRRDARRAAADHQHVGAREHGQLARGLAQDSPLTARRGAGSRGTSAMICAFVLVREPADERVREAVLLVNAAFDLRAQRRIGDVLGGHRVVVARDAHADLRVARDVLVPVRVARCGCSPDRRRPRARRWSRAGRRRLPWSGSRRCPRRPSAFQSIGSRARASEAMSRRRREREGLRHAPIGAQACGCASRALTRPRGVDAGQEGPHHPRGRSAPAGGARPPVADRAPARDPRGRGGRGARRPLRERRVHLRQEAAARDRPAHRVPAQALRPARGREAGRGRARPRVLRRVRHARGREPARSSATGWSAPTRATSRAAPSASSHCIGRALDGQARRATRSRCSGRRAARVSRCSRSATRTDERAEDRRASRACCSELDLRDLGE